MTEFSDRVYASLLVSEGYVPTIYKDGKGIPTIGMGYALVIPQGGTYKLRDNIDVILSSYLEDNPSLIPSVKTALEQARDALNKVSGAVNPFAAGYVLLANPTRLQQEIAKYGSAGTSDNFRTEFWEKKNVFEDYHKLAQNAVGINKWNKLTDNERTALYSLVYNGGSGIIGGGMDKALDLMTNNGASSTADKTTFTKSQFIGYLQFIYEILYRSNPARDAQGNLIPNRDGVQNRRFFEASEAIGSPLSSLPNAANASLTVPTATTEQAILAISFFNQYKDSIKDKLSNIPGYSTNPNLYLRDNMWNAVYTLFTQIKYRKAYNLNQLCYTWNVLTDTQIVVDANGRPTGEKAPKEVVEGTNVNDIIFINGNLLGTIINSGEGDDEIFGSNNKNIVNAGTGSDIIYCGGSNDIVDGGEQSQNVVLDMNKAYLGRGSDTYYGSNAIDFVDGGSGYNPNVDGKILDVISHLDRIDYPDDVNTVYLGGGSDTYYGNMGRDIVDGGTGNSGGYRTDTSLMTDATSDTNTIYLGGNSDEYYGGDGTDNVYGSLWFENGPSLDRETDTNKIFLGGGNDTYIGGDGKDIVYGAISSQNETNLEGEPTADHDKWGQTNTIKLGNGDDIYYGGRANDIVDGTCEKLCDKTIYLGAGDNVYTGSYGNDTVYAGNGNNIISSGVGFDEIHVGNGNNTIELWHGKIYLSSGGFNKITVGNSCEIYNIQNNDEITIDGSVNLSIRDGRDHIINTSSGGEVVLKNFYTTDGDPFPGTNLPKVNGNWLYWETEYNKTYSYNLGEDMPGERDNQPAAGLTPTSTTESALLVQAISSFNPGSSSSTGDLSSENWKAPELYSPGTVREMMKNIA